MFTTQNKAIEGGSLATIALLSGVAGILFWALSYAWIPFRLIGQETEVVWTFVVISEIMAEVAGLNCHSCRVGSS
ncbi:hypothetical protein GCM10023189_49230 [Nibrella saemangeumensis]|uniref:Uncharacterized protein n=1 Tax=Nibrella saemangeumensis TaxID=1084526 RepID=A0ABP8NJ01_9BACT